VSSWLAVCNPADRERFREAILLLRDAVGIGVTEEDIRAALHRHRAENPDMFGGKASDQEIESHVNQVSQALRSLD
jgi:hypothetical protein